MNVEAFSCLWILWGIAGTCTVQMLYKVSVMWVSGHTGIAGNELAYHLARETYQGGGDPLAFPTHGGRGPLLQEDPEKTLRTTRTLSSDFATTTLSAYHLAELHVESHTV